MSYDRDKCIARSEIRISVAHLLLRLKQLKSPIRDVLIWGVLLALYAVYGVGQTTADMITFSNSGGTWIEGGAGDWTPFGSAVSAYSRGLLGNFELRGIAEFDLSGISPLPNSSITLVLPDGGGASNGLSTTNIYYFAGNGVEETADVNRQDSFLLQTIRGPAGGNTFHDVTDTVNAFAADGHRYFGLLFVSVAGADEFGLNKTTTILDKALSLEFSDVGLPPPSGSVPEPSSIVLLALGGFGTLIGYTRRKLRTPR